jgi:hypothetical protein
MGFLQFALDPPITHWTRKGGRRSNCRVAWSPETLALWQCLHLSNTTLFVFHQYALERIILGLIAGFAGWSVLLPCQCCYNEPLVFCTEQHKTFLMKNLGPLDDNMPYPTLDSFFLSSEAQIPVIAFQGGRLLFQEEYIPLSNQKHIDRTMFCKDLGSGLVYQIVCSGLGYVVLNEWGFLSPIAKVAWSEVNWTTVQVVQGLKGKKSVSLHFEKTLVPIYKGDTRFEECHRTDFRCTFRTEKCAIRFLEILATLKCQYEQL